MKSDLHKPVLADEVLEAFKSQPLPIKRLLEGTFGRGGHSVLLLDQFKEAAMVSFDRDADAIEYGKTNLQRLLIDEGRLALIHDDFRNLANYKLGKFDGFFLDLGVSSPQFDNAQRGFSFQVDGPLDMRMNQNQDLTAAQILNEYSEKELSDLFYHTGEILRPNRVVRAIVHDRKEEPFTTTRQLAGLIERVEGWRKGKRTHPATQYFMALRIAVNEELKNLGEFIEEMPQHLNGGARMVIISFHSLEDRIVKNSFRKMNKVSGRTITKKVIIGKEHEIEENPRARSAKLRIFEIGTLD